LAAYYGSGPHHKAGTSSHGPTTPIIKADEHVARQLDRIVQSSRQGRLDAQHGRYDAAITNRQQTLFRLRQVHGGSSPLRQAIQTFKIALHWSLRSDEAYASGANASYYDTQSSRYKRIFLSKFNPIARRYGLATFYAGEI
jgi:hypothetical protein